MKKIFKNFLEYIYKNAVKLNLTIIKRNLEINNNALYLDLGCDDGFLTKQFGNIIGTSKIYGIEIQNDRAKLAEEKGIKISKVNLNDRIPFPDNFFDVVTCNQLIEHIYNSDNFISEIYRVLKPKGYAIISTENASSWCNILSSVFGWQIFSLTNFSDFRGGIGNPLALHRLENKNMNYWKHVRIYNIRGLKEYLLVFNFKIEKILGAGYFPFPAVLGLLDRIHCHFMIFKIRKL